MGTNLANVFALLADQESENVSTIAGLDSTDVNPKTKKDDKNKKKKSVDPERSYNGHQHNGRLNGYANVGNRGDGSVYKRSWQVKGNVGDGQANGSCVLHNGPADGLLKDGVHMTSRLHDNYRQRNRRPRVTEIEADQEFENDEVKAPDGGNQKQEADNSPVAEEVKASDGDNQELEASHGDNQERKASDGDNQENKAVDNHSNENQGKVSAVTEVLSKEELRERTRLAKEEAERKEKWHARQEERKREMAMKTLKEYEEQKAKKKAEKASMSVPEARVRGVTLDKDLESMLVLSKEKKDNIHTKQKSKNETLKKDNNIDKDAKVYKTMSIEEFRKLPTGSEGQGQGGPGSDTSEDSIKNTNGGGRGRGRGGISRNYDNSNHSGSRRGRGNSRDSRNYENFNHGGTGRGRSNSIDSRNNEQDNRGGIGRGSGRYSRNRAPDLSETSLFPVLAEALKPKKDL